MSKHDPVIGIPTPDQVRAALDRIAISEVFRQSPQLVSFLTFVVEAVLQGNSDRIKGYTIGVEVLRREDDFDPQIDPIVRVEATRLRRALERYYTGTGQADEVIIGLPRGSYVPTFNFRTEVLDNPDVSEIPHRMARPGFLLAAGSALFVLAAVAAWLVFSYRGSVLDRPGAASLNAGNLRPGNGLPVLFIEPFTVTGKPGPKSVAVNSLYVRLADAFSHFDLVNIRSQAEGSGTPASSGGRQHATQAQFDYRLVSAVEFGSDGAARLRFGLFHSGGDFIWSQAFDHVTADSRLITSDQIVGELAEILVQPFGIIYTDGRNRSVRTRQGDPRYRCVLEAAESFRSFNRAQQSHARSCLERLTSEYPNFGIGFTYLAALYLREYQYRLDVQTDGLPPLDRALRAARRGVELNPESSRAYEMLFVVLFASHDVAAAFAAGDKAIRLNKYDRRSTGVYAARLIANGDVDRGMNMLAKAEEDGHIIPAFEEFFLFLGHYMRNDMTRAAFHASQLTSDTFQLGLMARVLAAFAAGNTDAARQQLDRLVALNPAWRDDLRGSLRRFFESESVVNRLARDLAAAGLTSKSP